VTQHRKGLAPDLILLVNGEPVRRQGEKPARRIFALFGG